MKSLLAICALICVAVISGQSDTCSRSPVSWFNQNVNLPSQYVNGVQTYYANCRVWKARGGICEGQCRSSSWYSGTRYNENCRCCKPKSVRTITPYAICQYVVTFCPFVVKQWQIVRHPALNAHRYNYIQQCDCLSCGKIALLPSPSETLRVARQAAPEEVEVSAVDLSALPEFNRAPEVQADRRLRPSVVSNAAEKNRAVAQLSPSDQARRPRVCRSTFLSAAQPDSVFEAAPRRA